LLLPSWNKFFLLVFRIQIIISTCCLLLIVSSNRKNDSTLISDFVGGHNRVAPGSHATEAACMCSTSYYCFIPYSDHIPLPGTTSQYALIPSFPVNKQLNDKERVAAALENSNLLDTVEECLSPTLG
jgi:hypothetical protein